MPLSCTKSPQNPRTQNLPLTRWSCRVRGDAKGKAIGRRETHAGQCRIEGSGWGVLRIPLARLKAVERAGHTSLRAWEGRFHLGKFAYLRHTSLRAWEGSISSLRSEWCRRGSLARCGDACKRRLAPPGQPADRANPARPGHRPDNLIP
jgi:hypothetical protein